jgi:hypothetical protein
VELDAPSCGQSETDHRIRHASCLITHEETQIRKIRALGRGITSESDSCSGITCATR